MATFYDEKIAKHFFRLNRRHSLPVCVRQYQQTTSMSNPDTVRQFKNDELLSWR